MGRDSRTLWTTHDLLQPVCPVAQSRGVGPAVGGGFRRLQRRTGDDRFHLRARPPTWCDGQKRGPSDHGLGRSRGGLTSKIHALVDAEGRPVGLRLTGGQVHDACEAEALIEAIPEGATLLGDKGYDSNAIREQAERKNVWANIPNRSNRKQRFGFSPWLYRQRNLVERFFNRIKQFRGIATRYDRCPENYLAAVKLVCTRIWCHA